MEVDLTGVVLDGRYRVLEPISEGAMGVVYRAERVKLGRIVAVKVLHDELPAELSSRKRFEIEATAMAKLEHPHCAAVIDVGIHEDKPFVVMDYVSGDNLRDVVARGPLPLPRAVEIVRQVLTGLAHAHDLGIIHRDIKPANIVLSQKAGLGDHVKILDFGLARMTDTPSMTSGIVVGTPAYMAPEQIRGTLIDARADLYACGVLLFELLTGHKPFVSASDDPVEVCSMHLKNPPPTLASVQPGIEFGELEAIVARALAKAAPDRYASAVEFAAALDGAVPRRGSSPASAPIPMAVPMASPSGWVVPPDSKSSPASVASAPVSAAPSAPASVPVAVASPPSAASSVPPPSEPPVAPSEPSPTASSTPPQQQPAAAAAPAAPPPPPLRRSGKQPPAPFRAKSRTYDPPLASDAPASPPVATTTPEPPSPAPAAEPPKGLPASFDLSLAIPSPDVQPEPPPRGDTKLGLVTAPPPVAKPVDTSDATRLGLGTVAPPPVADTKGETRLGLVASDEPEPASNNHDATSFFAGAPPAGPSPLEAADLPAIAEPITLPPPPTLPALPVTRKQLQIIAAVCGVLLLLAIIVGTCGGKRSPASSTPDPNSETPSAEPENPDELAKATALAEAGKHSQAIELLGEARKTAPKDPRLSYLLGKELFATKQWSAGLSQLRETISLDGTYRVEPELIRLVVAAFNASPDYPEELGTFLREDIGPPVRQYLEETAVKHPRAAVRNRAKAELAKLR